MKSFFIIIALFFLPKFTFSQENFNLDFENWKNMGEFKNPENWDSSNETFMIGTYTPVTKDASAYSGTAAVKLKSTFIAQVGLTLIGVITLGDFEINTSTQKARVTGGKPYTLRPEKLTGFYKYSPVDGDSCGIIVDLFKYNSLKKQRDTIASALFTSNKNLSTWTYFELPLKYSSTEFPDSINIIALSSDTGNIKANSTLWLDFLSFQGTQSLEEEHFDNSIEIFPNPSSEFINLKIQDLKIQDLKIRVFSTDGKIIFEESSKDKNHKIDVSNFAKGNYFIWIKSGDKTAIKKFTVND